MFLPRVILLNLWNGGPYRVAFEIIILSQGSSTLILSMKRLPLYICDFRWFCYCHIVSLTMREENILSKSVIHGTMYKHTAIVYEQSVSKRVFGSLFFYTIGTFMFSFNLKFFLYKAMAGACLHSLGCVLKAISEI